TSFAQRNLKRKIAYSSISHMGFVLIGVGSFSALGTSGAMLQMVSHGLIGASLFFLVGATYDRTHTLQLDDMGGVGQKMRKMFALWTVCSLASLALPGMSGFVSELMVFVGFATSEAYSLVFRVVICILAAIGVILTPIYLLSMLREIFFGKENAQLVAHTHLVDAEPREIYVISCLLVPIIGIGLYPRLLTDTYRASIEALVQREDLARTTVLQTNSNPVLSGTFRPALLAPPSRSSAIWQGAAQLLHQPLSSLSLLRAPALG
ncbi:MAG: proton-conducting transporter membrane subunit, partial [Cyanobacteriota bacterium]|nr:proton-conducting transporter membrane subunit [Cyanobacteriota bacterium]